MTKIDKPQCGEIWTCTVDRVHFARALILQIEDEKNGLISCKIMITESQDPYRNGYLKIGSVEQWAIDVLDNGWSRYL